MSLTLRLLAIALAMSAILAGLVLHHEHRRSSGAEIRLDMTPVDPRDLLLGHYVILNTDLHWLDIDALNGPLEGWRRGDWAYVTLEAGKDGTHRAAALARTRPESGLFIRGRVSETLIITPGPGEPAPRAERNNRLGVRYNLERYYASQEEALALEAIRIEGRLRLIAAVSPAGDAVIRGLEIDGEDRLDRLF